MEFAMVHDLYLQCRTSLKKFLGLSACAAILVAIAGCSGGNRQSLDDAPVSGSVMDDRTSKQDSSRIAGQRVESLGDLSAYGPGFDRSVALRNLLAGADENELVELIQQSKEINSHSERRATQNAILQRFASLNPRAALAQVSAMPRFERDALIATTFSQWALDDLDGAADHAKSLKGFQKLAALRGILQSRDDLSEDSRRGLARRIGNEQLAIDLIAQSRLAGSMESPEAAWSALVNDDIGNAAQTGLLIQVAEAWFDQIGLNVLSEINRSLADEQTRNSVLRTMVHQLVRNNPLEAFDHVKHMEDTGSGLLLAVARAWASLDPESALNAASTVEAARLRRNLELAIAHVWATSDPHFILDNLHRLPESSQATARGQALMAIARTSPEEASLLVAGLDDPANFYSVAYTIVSSWVQTDVNAALDWVLSNEDLDTLREHLLPVVLNTLALENPELAMQTALNQPIGSYGSGMEYRVLSAIASNDPQKALELLPQVREGQTSYYAHISVGGALVRAGDADSAFELAANLQGSERDRYYGNLIATWAANDVRGLYDSIDRFPTAQTKSSAALTLITWNAGQKILSDVQIDRAKDYLTSKDAQTLEKGDASTRFGFRAAEEQRVFLQNQ